MRRVIPLCVLIAASAAVAAAVQPQQGQTPPGHPPVAPPANQFEEPPPANPEDVGSIDAIVGAFYDSISGAKGVERDWDRFRSLFAGPAKLIASRPMEGGAALWPLTPNEFIAFNQKYFEAGGYFEAEIARRTERFGNIAHVWSTYESRQDADAPDPYSRGIYSIQLLKDGDRWWIVTMYWDYERDGVAIPDTYLETP